MLQLAFPRNNKIIASYVTHSAKSKVTKSLKRSPIITSQVVILDLKKRKKNQRYVPGESFNVYINILGCEYNIFSYVNYYILYCFRNLDWLMRRVSMSSHHLLKLRRSYAVIFSIRI